MSSEMDKLAALLADRKSATDQSKATAEQDFDAWLRSVPKLYTQIAHWLEPLVGSGLVTISSEDITLKEQLHQGPYEIPMLQLDLGGKTLKFKPAGTYFIGNHGLIEVLGGKGSVQLTRHVHNDGEEWYIGKTGATRGDRIPLDKETFAMLLQEKLG